ncbi:MAG: glycosyltransferase family 4 protein [Candidatus Eremiobacteraeota bacterium]|nr:glycosyltransferase family 4 protein [Candidatus Eremiobacteraeota bacterium]
MNSQLLRVVHLVDPLGGSEHLWGKERVIALMLRAQRQAGDVAPELATFGPSLLGERMRAEGFAVSELARHTSAVPIGALRSLARRLKDRPADIVHTHGYKANVAARAMRPFLFPRTALVSTSHGWVGKHGKLPLYYALDRLTAGASDAVTVPDARMAARLMRGSNGVFVANAIEPRPLPSAGERHAARAGLGLSEDAFVAGTAGRLAEEKGIDEYLAAARATPSVVWAMAGAGPYEDEIRAVPEIHFAGYQADVGAYLAALDVYVQASRDEGLALALLEAMRAGKPIVATAVGATTFAVRDGREALIVPPHDAARLAAAVERLRNDADLRARLGQAARERFEAAFEVDVQQRAFLAVYRAVLDRRR